LLAPICYLTLLLRLLSSDRCGGWQLAAAGEVEARQVGS
jgi:hypothetical protein